MNDEFSGGGPSVCEVCPKAHPKKFPNMRRSVPVSMVFGGVSRCPTHTLQAIKEAGLTLNQAMGCNHE